MKVITYVVRIRRNAIQLQRGVRIKRGNREARTLCHLEQVHDQCGVCGELDRNEIELDGIRRDKKVMEEEGNSLRMWVQERGVELLLRSSVFE
jgi:hypothetical protein